MSKQIIIHAASIAAQIKETLGVENKKAILKNIKLELSQKFATNTVRTYLTIYRNALKTAKIESKSLFDILTVHKAKVKKIANEYRNKLELVTQENKTIKVSEREVLEIIEYAKDLLTSDSYYKTALAASLLCGRRTVEVLYCGKFNHGKGKSVVFGGQAKKKGSKSKPFKIPLLVDFQTLKPALEYLRVTKCFDSEKDVNIKASSNLHLTIKTTFRRHFPYIESPHDLRKLYAAICYYNHGKGQSFKMYASSILGHGNNERDALTTEAYYKFQITNK